MWLLIIMAAAFSYAYYRGCPLNYFNRHYLQFVTAGLILSCVSAVAVFIKTRNCPLIERAPSADGLCLSQQNTLVLMCCYYYVVY